MAKFINKKEQVFDFQLTTYGRHLLSAGTFKPVYYAFYDDNVIYDNRYVGTGSGPAAVTSYNVEPQNNIHTRIKTETQYLEGLTLFEDVEENARYDKGGTISYEDPNTAPTPSTPGKQVFRFNSAIGDAYLDAAANVAPAWKVVALQSEISSSAVKNTTEDESIPQINIDANYTKEVVPGISELQHHLQGQGASGVRALYTESFIDGNAITIKTNDPLIYVEELNTRLLTENFSLEVFEIFYDVTSRPKDTAPQNLERKFFERHIPQIVDGIMVSPTPIKNPEQALTTDSVEYYFDVLTDQEINKGIACRGAEVFDKQSYYIDLDFECDKPEFKQFGFDIYGAVTEPEICQS